MTKLKLTFTVIVLIIIGTMGGIMTHLAKENNRIKNNEKILLDEKESANKELILTKSQLKDFIESENHLSDILKDSLDIKKQQIKSLVKASQKTKIVVRTELKDTTIFKMDTFYVFKAFNWSNGWYDAKGAIDLTQDSLMMQISSVDTLYVIDNYYKNGKWFLPRWFEKRKLKTDIVNKNPWNNIEIERKIRRR